MVAMDVGGGSQSGLAAKEECLVLSLVWTRIVPTPHDGGH